MAEVNPEPTNSPQWGFADLLQAILILAFLGCAAFQFIRIPFRSVKGVRVEFEQDYRCSNMKGKVYWLHPEAAESVLEQKRYATFAPCEIYDQKCQTHRLEIKANEGAAGWLLNY